MVEKKIIFSKDINNSGNILKRGNQLGKTCRF